jgi:trimethylamine monooxygenase
VRDLIDATDYPDFPIEKQSELLKSWLQDKEEDILGFRNKSYRSTITGTLAANLPRPWLDIKDDSLEGFMALKFEAPEEMAGSGQS